MSGLLEFGKPRGYYAIEVTGDAGQWVREFRAGGDDGIIRLSYSAAIVDDCERYMRNFGWPYRIVAVTENVYGEYNLMRMNR